MVQLRYPLVDPNPPRLSEHLDVLTRVEQSGIYSNNGPELRAFEAEATDRLFGGQGACLGVANATLGLMLAIRQAMGRERGTGKLALMLQVKGLKDASGSPVTGRLTVEIPASRITILSQGIGTLGENSPLAAQPPYVVDVKNGAARAKFLTPSTTPGNGLIVNTFGAPVVYDPEGKELASTGTQSKP